MEIKVNKKEAFSLAEAMVVLVIIAIVMAMAAPLIAHKANTDQKRLIFNGVGAHIATAMGNAQNFGIGDNNPNGENNAKLLVKAKKSDQNLVAKFISNFTVNDSNAAKAKENAEKIIFQVLPKSSDSYVSTYGNPGGFKVFADGTTNAACIPDYKNPGYSLNLGLFYGTALTGASSNPSLKHEPNTSVTRASAATREGNEPKSIKWTFYKDGYFRITRCVYLTTPEDYDPTNDKAGAQICPPIDITSIQLPNKEILKNEYIPKLNIKRVYQGYVTIPVSKGMMITDAMNHFEDADGIYTDGNYNYPVDGYNAAVFFPCRK